MVAYTDIRNRFTVITSKYSGDGLAYLTHYWQNSGNGESKYFKQGAETFLKNELRFGGIPLDILDIPDRFDVPFPPPRRFKFKFVDLFAGIGGIRIAYQNLGGKCVFSSEWNNFAKQTYEANFGEVPFGDIRKIKESDIPDHDLLLAGFPCQPFSIAGVSKKNALGRKHGFLDETQGTLFFDIARIIDKKRPAAFMLENVKNLVSHDKGKTFKVIESTLRQLGYSLHYKILDSRHFVPQHRERILLVGLSEERFSGEDRFSFPEPPDADWKFQSVLETIADKKYTLTDHLWSYLRMYAEKHKAKGNGFGYGLTDLEGISRTLSARYYKDGSEILIPQEGKNPRRLTPRECARLQGFPDSFVIPVSDTQAYKQFGNSVTVPLIQYVGKRVVKELVRAVGPH